jgi:predicted ATPase with chaperone activity
MPSSIKILAAAALSAAWLLAAPAADAQTRTQTQPQTQQSTPSITDQKLDAAAAAIEQVTNVKKSYQQRMASATPAEKQKLSGEASNAMEKAVTDQGLSIDEYDSILEVAQNDPSVRERLLQRIHLPAK